MRMLGIDEAGRGPVIGPLVIAGVMVDEAGSKELARIGVRDSKVLTPSQRERLAEKIKDIALDYAVLKISAGTINREMASKNLNRIEMERIAKIISLMKPDVAYIDAVEANTRKFAEKLGQYLKEPLKIIAENKADSKYPVVAAASIIAKTTRDREMAKISARVGMDMGSGYPGDERTMSAMEDLLKGEGRKYVRTKWVTVKRILDKMKQEGLGRWIGKG